MTQQSFGPLSSLPDGSFGASSNLDLIRVAHEVAEQKGLQFSDILGALESAIKIIAQKEYGKDKIKVEINHFSGEIHVSKGIKVIKSYDDEGYDVNDGFMHTPLEEARKIHPDIKVGDEYYVSVEGMQLKRMHVQHIRRSLVNMINSIEREKQFKEYGSKLNEIIFGVVRRVEHGGIIVEHNGNELCLPTNQLIGKETFRGGDRIKACIDKVRRADFGHQVLISRSSNAFLAALMKQEIPEIYDGVVSIKALARIPGVRAKVAVYSADPNVDAIGACIGRRGMRINNVSRELSDEKIDVIMYSSDVVTFVINSLSPAEISRVLMDEDTKKIEVVCAESKLNMAIGKDGANVRLASKLVGWSIDVMSEDMENKRRIEEFNLLTSKLSQALDVEDIIAQLLLAEGYGSVEEVANSSLESLASISGFNEELAAQLIARGKKHLAATQVAKGSGLESILAGYRKFYDVLSMAGISTVRDFADLSIDDIIEIVGSLDDYGMNDEIVGNLVITARRIEGMLDRDVV